ncbi:MAG: hypothetical protein WC136_01260 [Sphaerochaeta sp.]
MLKIIRVHCIENKIGHEFEQDAKIMITSLRQYDSCEVIMIQPSENDITIEMEDFLKQNNVKFIKKLLHNPQVEQSTNYTNIPVILNYFQNNLECTHIMYSDLDVIYFDKLDLPDTDKCYLTIIPGELTDCFIEGEFIFDKLYQKYFKDQIYKIFGIVTNLKYFVNTWFIYAPRNHIFWKLYIQITFELLELSKDIIYPDIENHCEEIAASIIYSAYSDQFIDVTELSLAFQENNLHDTRHLYSCDNNTKLYHYHEIEYFLHSVDSLPNLNNTINTLLKHIPLNTISKVFKLSLKEISHLIKGIK